MIHVKPAVSAVPQPTTVKLVNKELSSPGITALPLAESDTLESQENVLDAPTTVLVAQATTLVTPVTQDSSLTLRNNVKLAQPDVPPALKTDHAKDVIQD